MLHEHLRVAASTKLAAAAKTSPFATCAAAADVSGGCSDTDISPTAIKAWQELQDIIDNQPESRTGASESPKGLIAQYIMSESAVFESWQSHASVSLLLHALLQIPIPVPDRSAGPHRVEAVRTMMQIGIHMAQYEGGCRTSWQAIDWHIA